MPLSLLGLISLFLSFAPGDVSAQPPLLDQVFHLLLEVVTIFYIVAMVLMEAAPLVGWSFSKWALMRPDHFKAGSPLIS